MNGFLKETELKSELESIVRPALRACRTDGKFLTGDGKELYYARFDAEKPRGTAVILHGFTESAEKYEELIWFFLQNGLSVCLYEQRGHGRSFRAVDDRTLTHIDRFEDYVNDFDSFCKTVVSASFAPYYLFAHSMGGAVAALWLERGGEFFRRAVLSSPMIAPATGGAPVFAAKAICRVFFLLGKGKKRIFLSSPYPGFEKFADSCATSEARFDVYESIKSGTPEFQNYSPTYRWLYESLKVRKKILQPGKVEKIAIPVTVFSAAEDTVVLPEPQKAFAERLKSGAFLPVLNAKHEIFRSSDETLKPYLEEILRFFLPEEP